jgi:hypothetical protein
MPGGGKRGPKTSEAPGKAGAGSGVPFELALIFTGHMIDLPDRASPRFPPEMERMAATAIRRRVTDAARSWNGSVIGIASGARGGDILFLEACKKAGLATRVILPFEPEQFLDSSVRGIATGGWDKRFFELWNAVPRQDREVLKAPQRENPYDLCNRRMLELAKKQAKRCRLLALWDGKDTELKPGGTATFVALVREAKGRFSHIDSNALLRKLQEKNGDTRRERRALRSSPA